MSRLGSPSSLTLIVNIQRYTPIPYGQSAHSCLPIDRAVDFHIQDTLFFSGSLHCGQGDIVEKYISIIFLKTSDKHNAILSVGKLTVYLNPQNAHSTILKSCLPSIYASFDFSHTSSNALTSDCGNGPASNASRFSFNCFTLEPAVMTASPLCSFEWWMVQRRAAAWPVIPSALAFSTSPAASSCRLGLP